MAVITEGEDTEPARPKPYGDTVGPVRPNDLEKISKSMRRGSRAGTAELRRAEDRMNKQEPGCVLSSTESINADLAKPMTNSVKSAQPDDCGDKTRPKRKRSEAEAANPKRTKLRRLRAGPKVLISMADREEALPKHDKPQMKTVKPSCAELCGGTKGPGCRRSSAESEGPKQPELCASSGKPGVATSMAGREDTEPHLEMPTIDTRSPIRVKPCNSGTSSRRKKSSANGARPKHAKLRTGIGGSKRKGSDVNTTKST